MIKNTQFTSGIVTALALIAVGPGCGGSTDIDFTGYDGGADAATGGGGSGGSGASTTGGSAGSGNFAGTGAGGSAGSPGGAGGVGAGGAGGCGPCPQPPPSPIGQVTSCCAGDKCGITIDLLGGQCLELGQPGSADPSCPTQNVQGFPLQGCCKPSNVCGLMDPLFGLGCVDPSQFGQPAGPPCGGGTGGSGTGGTGTGGTGTGGVGTGGTGTGGSTAGEVACGSTANPTTCAASEKCCVLTPGLDYCAPPAQQCACTSPNCDTIDVECDGPEDCPGQVCCGIFSFQQNQYTDLRCQNNCGGPNQREICKPGQQCQNPNFTCSQSPSLPSYLYRCN
ncbi:MAG: hypothetical protein R3B13_02565 [Polyangiaceae bacterium]